MSELPLQRKIEGIGTIHRPELVSCVQYPHLVFYRGLVSSFPIYMAELDRPEKVVASSNKLFVDGQLQVFVGYPKARHHHLITLIVEVFGDKYDKRFCYPHNQGFMTSHGRIVTRTQARKIAEAQKQLLEGAYEHRHLFSEDIW
jgi:hypothetical protein